MLLSLSIQERNLIIAFIQTTVFNITIMSHSYQDCKRNKGSNDEVQHRNHSKASHLWWECSWERHNKIRIDRMEHSTMDALVLSLYFLVEERWYWIILLHVLRSILLWIVMKTLVQQKSCSQNESLGNSDSEMKWLVRDLSDSQGVCISIIFHW